MGRSMGTKPLPQGLSAPSASRPRRARGLAWACAGLATLAAAPVAWLAPLAAPEAVPPSQRSFEAASPAAPAAAPRISRRAAAASLVLLGPWSAAALTVDEDEDCACCQGDWCGCDNCTDCHGYLERRGFSLPLEAKAASAQAGGGWAEVLGWQAALPRLPAAGPLAEGLTVAPSGLQGAGQGLFAKGGLAKGAVLPPYRGRQLNFAEGMKGGDYVWCPVSAGVRMALEEEELAAGRGVEEPSYCVDASKEEQQNPARFVNGAGTREECARVNLEICQLGDVMYFRTTRPVAPGQELVTDYGDFYWSNNEPC